MTASSRRRPYYRPVRSAVLRASAHTPEMNLPPWPGDDAGAEPWRIWMATIWSNRTVAEAVALASPALADQIEQVLAGRPAEAIAARLMGRALARYLLRLRGRATPFGTFAGVAAASFGPHTAWQWSEDHRPRTRADAVWLAAVTARLEAVPELLARLSVQINTLAVTRGGRLVVPWQPHQSVRSHGAEEAERSVRLVPVVETIRDAARSPIHTADLVDKVTAEHPGADRRAVEQVVTQLVAVGALISSLRAPATVTDALAHLLEQLHQAGAGDLAQTKPLADELRLIHAAMGRHGAGRVPGTEWDRRVLIHRMRQVTPDAEHPLTVDLRLGADLELPHTVADEAARAAEALIRLSTQTAASTSWRAYHRDFLTRYGPGVLVPVAEMTDSVTGLGFPRHFTEQPGVRETLPRNEALLALAQQAALDGVEEIELDAELLGTLTVGHADGPQPVTAADLWTDLRAESRDAVDAGDFTLGVGGFGRSAATTGRFLDLLDGDDRQEMTSLYSTLPASVQGAVAAQLSFPPRHPRTENVLRVPAVYGHLIPLAEHRTDHEETQLPLADLAIAADARRLYVVSLSRRRVVEPVLPHAGARHTMPPLARLLFEIPRSAHPAVTAFDWGTAACLPYRPRLRYGRSILAPAQWRLDPSDLPGPHAPMSAWESALDRLREQRGMPVGVAVGAVDRRLRLDLGEAMDRAVLRDQLKAADGPLTVAEAPLPGAYGWCEGRAHELVIPLAATAPADPAPAFLATSAPLPVTHPGAETGVVFVKLFAPAQVHDEILAVHLPELLKRWASEPPWWFTRYRHPADHLRIRVHDTDGARAAGHLAAWAGHLRQRGLVGEIAFDSYVPETGRYGGGTAMAAAEELFAADSSSALAQLAFLSVNRDVRPQALTAASLVDLAAAVTGSTAAGRRWLLQHPEYAATAAVRDRDVRRQTFRLAEEETPTALPGGAELVAAWAARTEAATRYTGLLTATAGRLTPQTVLGSLLHMHHNRAAGIDPEAEAVTYKLARAVALPRTQRKTKTVTGGDR